MAASESLTHCTAILEVRRRYDGLQIRWSLERAGSAGNSLPINDVILTSKAWQAWSKGVKKWGDDKEANVKKSDVLRTNLFREPTPDDVSQHGQKAKEIAEDLERLSGYSWMKAVSLLKIEEVDGELTATPTLLTISRATAGNCLGFSDIPRLRAGADFERGKPSTQDWDWWVSRNNDCLAVAEGARYLKSVSVGVEAKQTFVVVENGPKLSVPVLSTHHPGGSAG